MKPVGKKIDYSSPDLPYRSNEPNKKQNRLFTNENEPTHSSNDVRSFKKLSRLGGNRFKQPDKAPPSSAPRFITNLIKNHTGNNKCEVLDQASQYIRHKCSDVNVVKCILQTLEKNNIPLDASIYECAINVCKQAKQLEDALTLYEELKNLHIRPTERTHFDLLSLCKKLLPKDKYLAEVNTLYKDIKKYETLSEHVCNELFIAYQNDSEKVEELRKEMKENSVPYNECICNTLMTAYIKNNLIDEAVKLVDKSQAARQHLQKAVNAYLTKHCNDVTEAKNILDKLKGYSDISNYNAAISSCLERNDSKDAWQLFDKIKEDKLRPNIWTYNICLQIYKKNGQLEEMKQLYEKMCNKLNDYPKPDEHTSSILVNAYAKSKKLEEARKLFDSIQPTELDYTALLTAYEEEGLLAEADNLIQQGIEAGVFKGELGFSFQKSAWPGYSAQELKLDLHSHKIFKNTLNHGKGVSSSVARLILGRKLEDYISDDFFPGMKVVTGYNSGTILKEAVTHFIETDPVYSKYFTLGQTHYDGALNVIRKPQQ